MNTPNKGPTIDKRGYSVQYVQPGMNRNRGTRWKSTPEREEKRPGQEKHHWKKYLCVEWRFKEFNEGEGSSNGKTRENTEERLGDTEGGDYDKNPVIEQLADDGGKTIDPERRHLRSSRPPH